MTTEQNEPQATEPRTSEGQGAATQVQIPGQTRRRRRRRRNKSQGKPQPTGQAAPAEGQPAQASPSPTAQATPSPQNAPGPRQAPRQRSQGRQFSKGNGGSTGNGNGSGSNGHYGNGNGNGGGQKQAAGGRRKGKQQRRQQVFVGPMDHSYRTVNGNVADHGHQQNHNYEFRGMPHSGFYGEQDVFSLPAVAAPLREDAPVRIYFFIEDLFFVAKIQEASKKLGVKVEFAKADKETLAKITGAGEERASLIVFDLNNLGAKPLTVIPKLKAKLKKSTSIVGFLSHLQGDLKAKAIEVGCDTVMPRAAFSQNLPNLLRRYGLHDEEEENFNQ